MAGLINILFLRNIMENFLSIEQTTGGMHLVLNRLQEVCILVYQQETVVLDKKSLLKVGICKEHIMSLFHIQIKTQEKNLENKYGA